MKTKPAQFSTTIKNKVRKYFRSRKEIDYVILFGSAVTHLRPDSDIDLLVGSDVVYEERIIWMGDLEKVFHRSVDVVPVKTAPSEVVLDAFSKGEAVLVRRRKKLNADYFRHFRLFENRIGLNRVIEAHLKRRFSHG